MLFASFFLTLYFNFFHYILEHEIKTDNRKAPYGRIKETIVGG